MTPEELAMAWDLALARQVADRVIAAGQHDDIVAALRRGVLDDLCDPALLDQIEAAVAEETGVDLSSGACDDVTYGEIVGTVHELLRERCADGPASHQ